MTARPYYEPNHWQKVLHYLQSQRKAIYGAILVVALIGFEVFNYSTTELALGDLLGELRFAGFRWATILAVAFCGIDFAGIARLFLPESHDSRETWYLMGAWLIAATMNAVLTWWSISLVLVNRTLQSSSFISQDILIEVIPVFIAVLVWITRILLIGTFSFDATWPEERTTERVPERNMAQVERSVPNSSIPGAQPLRLTRKEAIYAQSRKSKEIRPEPEYVSENSDEAYIPVPELRRNAVIPVDQRTLR
ncbi:hypothetical protein BECAL_02377 [Bellilinea caldifistulae]|uniref:Uncharacterized protein n=1 Tax=Bellilinea caldifistulae TaxID=360411 RepID=A0A0P6WUH0_9CHLR|nr:hypothetical protein [Bellilinea caldifistulae]KPL73901.1 hypothetical protein AC812_14060 [Bellilinea caldifistulae]GAP11191.1 hypothetical protein BECAL_02377 [Bellilinea caldifistulae]